MRYSPLRHISSVLWKRRPIQLTVFLTRKCNARCPFCFYLSRGAEGQGTELSLGEIEKVSRSVGRLLWLAFSGGEPFLRSDLVETAEAFYRNNRPCIMLIPTNGLLPEHIRESTEAILKRCPKSVVAVKLSLDGPDGVHDSLRGVPGAFQKVMATYRSLKGLIGQYPNFELGINSVFCAANQDRMAELCRLVRGLDPSLTHTVSLIRGSVSDQALKNADIAKYRDTIEEMAKNLREGSSGTYRFRGGRLKAAQDILQRRLIDETALRQKRLVSCYAGRLNLVLTETGDVYPCESFERKMGNVRETGYDMPALLKAGPAQQAVHSVRQSGCYCTHECYMMTNILFNPRLYPALIREYVRLSGRSRLSAGKGPVSAIARAGF